MLTRRVLSGTDLAVTALNSSRADTVTANKFKDAMTAMQK